MTVFMPASRPHKVLSAATALAGTSRCRFKHGAVVVRRGQILSSSVNVKRHEPCEESWRDSHVHAEFAAVRAAGPRAAGATVYVARINAAGEPAESKPCLRCQGAMRRAGIKKVVYTVLVDSADCLAAA